MSSFVDDNVSESKKQKITEIEENITETAAAKTTKNNQTENKETITNNDNKIVKPDENNENTIIENKSANCDNNIIKITVNRYDNASNSDIFGVVKDTSNDNKIVEDNCQILIKSKNDKLAKVQISSESDILSCKSISIVGDIEQERNIASLEKKVTSSNKLSTSISNRHGEECNTIQTLRSSSFFKNDGSEFSGSSSSSVSSTSTATSPLPPLPSGLNSSVVSNLPHISSEPTFGVQLRNNKNSLTPISNSGSSARDWRPNTSSPNTCSVINSGTVSASASPNMVRKASESSVLLPRRVSFPKSDDELVTGYLEPANPWMHVCMVKSISEIAELYMASCQKHNTKPLQSILDHLKAVDLTKQTRRQPLLSLKSVKLAPSDCEALEEVLKRTRQPDATIITKLCRLQMSHFLPTQHSI